MEGAYYNGQYLNRLERLGYSQAEIDNKLESTFEEMFYGPEGVRLCHCAGPDMMYIEDTGNHDVRTEGMSYGMMMCVQMNRKDLFDKLWTFSMRYMHLSSGVHQGYFAWSVQLDGKHNAEGPAPDGEEYFAMALLMASARWGDGEGIFAYRHWAQDILRHCVHQAEMVEGGQPMWNPENHYIKFVPGMEISDPSYHLPHFYHLFAKFSDERDHAFWAEAEAASRRYIALCAHPVTGLSPEYAAYDGTPVLMFGKNYAYYSDAYRVIMNIASNAVKYNKPGGSVHCSAEQMDLVGDRVVYRFIISDTGIGIPPEEREKVFERFYRVDKARSREAGGTGLGLSIVHDTVLQAGGSIRLTEGCAGGACFQVTLPLAREESA